MMPSIAIPGNSHRRPVMAFWRHVPRTFGEYDARTERAPRSGLGDRAAFRALGELGVLGKNSGRVTRLRQLPVGAAAGQLVVGNVEVDRQRVDVDHDAIAVPDERDRPAVD